MPIYTQTLEQLQEILEQQETKIKSQQAQIDALMLEYCPNEMLPQQLLEWENAQERIKFTGNKYA